MRKRTQPITLPPNAHILVVKMAGIGDLLLATPALRSLRETYPQAQIDLLVTPASAGLLDGWEVINHTIVLDKYLFDYPQQIIENPRNLRRLTPVWRELRAGHYDAVLLMHHLTLPFGRLKHQLLMRATGAKWRVGLGNGHGWFLNVCVKDKGFGAMHEAEYCLAVAAAVGATTNDKRLTVPLSEEDRQRAWQLVYGNESPDTINHPIRDPSGVGTQFIASQFIAPDEVSNPINRPIIDPSGVGSQFIASQFIAPDEVSNPINRPIIAMHPGSGSYSTARRWAPGRFAQLADTLFHDVGGQLLLMGGPEEAELNQQVMSMMHSDMPVRNLAGKGNVKVAAAVLELVDLFVGNDSALMHLAVAAGTPTVAIFGLTNSKAWGPYTGDVPGRHAVVVSLDLPCMPCFYRGHDLGTPEGCATRDCLALLGVDPVAVAARRLLRERWKGKQAEIRS